MTKAKPAIIAGLQRGSAHLKNNFLLLIPKLAAASIIFLELLANENLAIKYT